MSELRLKIAQVLYRIPPLRLTAVRLAKPQLPLHWNDGRPGRLRTADYFYHCIACGGSLEIDAIEEGTNSLRVHLIFENTGELGDLRLELDSTVAELLSADVVKQWRSEFEDRLADVFDSDRFLPITRESAVWIGSNASFCRLYPSVAGGLPRRFRPFERWEGWLESCNAPLPADTQALMLIVAPSHGGRCGARTSDHARCGWLARNDRLGFEMDALSANSRPPRARFPAVPPPQSKYYPRLREVCLSLPGTWEDYPWGETVFKGPNNKIFASFYQREDGALGVGMRVSPAEQGAVTQIPFVQVAAYSGKYGGITASVSDDASYELVRDLILTSYHHVNPPKKTRTKR